MKPGDRVATLAMNHDRHLVAWFGAIGMGGVLHTINPRLFDDQLEYIVNHAEDRVLLYDHAFAPLVERMKPRWTTIEHYICFDPPASSTRLARRRGRRLSLGRGRRARSLRPLLHQRHDRQSQGRALRASLDHASRHADHRARHLRPVGARRWCCRSCRCSMPMLGPALGRADDRLQAGLCGRLSTRSGCASCSDEEGVTHSAGVPTVWLGMIDHVERTGEELGKLKQRHHRRLGRAAGDDPMVPRPRHPASATPGA